VFIVTGAAVFSFLLLHKQVKQEWAVTEILIINLYNVNRHVQMYCIGR